MIYMTLLCSWLAFSFLGGRGLLLDDWSVFLFKEENAKSGHAEIVHEHFTRESKWLGGHSELPVDLRGRGLEEMD